MPPSNRRRTSPQRSTLARESPPHDRLDVPRALLGEALRCLEERLVFRPPRGRHVGAEVRRRHHHAHPFPYPTSTTSPRKQVELPVSIAFATVHSKYAWQSSSTGAPSVPTWCGTSASLSRARPLVKPSRWISSN